MNGVTEPTYLEMGSGTVVSADGLILTNWHVVDMEAHRHELDTLEAQSARQGEPLSIELDDEVLMILTSDGANPPEPQYLASVVAQDEMLDLAVLQVVSNDAGSLSPAQLNLPFIPVGDSDAIRLGDTIDIYGYPGVAGDSLTFTRGVTSGFAFEGTISGRAWIITDAGMSGGSSGGTAVNSRGELVGIPTSGSSLDCRPGDTNFDGVVDASDVGCIPVGASFGQLRPVNLALALLRRAGWTPAG